MFVFSVSLSLSLIVWRDNFPEIWLFGAELQLSLQYNSSVARSNGCEVKDGINQENKLFQLYIVFADITNTLQLVCQDVQMGLGQAPADSSCCNIYIKTL